MMLKRIGLLIPSSNTVLEVDFYRNISPEYSLHTARMLLEDTNPASFFRMVDEYSVLAARDVATTKPSIVVFGCANAGILKGMQFDIDLCEKLSKITNTITLSAFGSIKNGLERLQFKNLLVVTPYTEKTNMKIKYSLEENGLNVIKISGFGIIDNFEIASISEDDIYDFSVETVGNLRPDGLLLSCTNFRAMSTLARLRDHFPFPVVCSNQLILERTLNYFV